MTGFVAPEIPWSRIWHLNFTETKKSHQYFNWNSYQPWSNTPCKKQLIGSHLFFSPGDTHTKGVLFLLHLSLEGVTEVATDPKERLVSFKVTISKSSLFVPLQIIAPQSSWLGSAFLKDYKNMCKMKMWEMKTK